MPSLKASAQVNMKGWEQVINAPSDQQQGDDPSTAYYYTRDPFMHASMPLMASTNDALSQYYSSTNLPQQRILPARPGGAVT